jgi:hypothetical protein
MYPIMAMPGVVYLNPKTMSLVRCTVIFWLHRSLSLSHEELSPLPKELQLESHPETLKAENQTVEQLIQG